MKQRLITIPMVLLSIWMAIGVSPRSQAQVIPRKLELRGRVLVPPGTLSRRRWITVNLLAVGSPYYSRTTARQDGAFKFKKLLPGTYTILFSIPRIGQLTRTVEITPSFASAKGIVEKQFEFTPELMSLLLRPYERGMVSVRELKISYSARREFEKAQSRLRSRDAEGAMEHLEKAVRESPEFLEALNSLGVIHFQRKEYAAAEQEFRRALALDEDAFEPALNLGGVLLTQGKARQALEINQRAMEIFPQDALATAQLGLSHYLLNDYGQAIFYLNRAKELDPAHFTFPQITLAQIYLRLKQPEDAMSELKEFLELHPDSTEVPRVREMLAAASRAVNAMAVQDAESGGL